MIIDAVIPLILEHGVGVTSRQIAEAVGVAEGTIFRAFGDKESLIAAAADAFFERGASSDSGPFIDASLPLDEKLEILVDVMRHRVRNVMRMAMLTGRRGPTPSAEQLERFNRVIADAFAPDIHRLRVRPDRLAQYVRVLAIATSIPVGGPELTDAEIVELITHGILVSPETGHPKKD
jgi:AcrR family transcriptional regulator